MEAIDKFKAELNNLLNSMIGHSITIMKDGFIQYYQSYVPILDGDTCILWDMCASKKVDLDELKASDMFEIMEAFEEERKRLNRKK